MSVRGQRILPGVLLLISLPTGLGALLAPRDRWVGGRAAAAATAEVRR
jgi:hypothetical protein